MRSPRTTLALACLLAALGAAGPLRAQTAADSAALARATATLLADSVLPQIRGVVIWQALDDPFGASVAEGLRDVPQVGRPAADPEHAVHMGIRGVSVAGDTARVVVETWQRYKETGLLNSFAARDAYVFDRSGGTWRFVRKEFISIADFGPVRGR
jgi:hypothetical protein